MDWTSVTFQFNKKTLSKEHRTSSKLIHQAQILGHNPAVRLTVIRTIRPRKINTFVRVGELEHPLLLLQENFIPDFRLTHKQWQMKQGH